MRSIVPLLLSLVPLTASGQTATATSQVAMLTPGAEVRITTRSGRSYRGHLDGVTPDSVRINAPVGWDARWALRAIPRDSIAFVEVMRRGDGHAAIGAVIGLGVGGTLGLVGAALNCTVFCSPQQTQQSSTIFVAALLGGGVLGALVGSATRSESWSEVPLRPTVTIAPTGRGVGFGLSLQF